MEFDAKKKIMSGKIIWFLDFICTQSDDENKQTKNHQMLKSNDRKTNWIGHYWAVIVIKLLAISKANRAVDHTLFGFHLHICLTFVLLLL